MRSTGYFFFFNDTATTEIYTLSLHDALPISAVLGGVLDDDHLVRDRGEMPSDRVRSEEHTSELQSQSNLVCRLLLEKKKTRYRRLDRVHGRLHDSNRPALSHLTRWRQSASHQ